MMFGDPSFHQPSFVAITPRAGNTVQTHFACLSYSALDSPVHTARLLAGLAQNMVLVEVDRYTN